MIRFKRGDNMALMLEKLLETLDEFELKWVAGQKNSNNIVEWFDVIENVELAESIEERTIIFTTGLGLNKKEDFIKLIRSHISHGASGTIINTGQFISEIPEDIVIECEKHDYPLLVVPSHIKLPKLMKIFSYLLLESEKAGLELGAALKNAISFPTNYDLYARVFYQYGFKSNENYCMAIIQPCDMNNEIDEVILQSMIKMIEKTLMSFGNKSFIINSGGTFILLFSGYSHESVSNIVNKVIVNLITIWRAFFVGIGNTVESLSGISNSYIQALKTIDLNKKLNIFNKIVDYRELGIYKILLAVKGDTLADYYNSTLGKLEEYDKKNHTNLLAVLQIYMKNNGSLNETSEELFFHRNTVNYKVRKIEQILNLDLSNIESRALIYIALEVKNIIGNSKTEFQINRYEPCQILQKI